jgi:hypothetical protein
MVDKKKAETKKSKVDVSAEKLAEIRAILGGNSKFEALDQYKRPGFFYRIVSVDGSELKHSKLGYEPVKDSTGNVVSIDGGLGVKQILMCIPDEVRKVITSVKNAENNEVKKSVDPRLRRQDDASFTEAMYSFKDETI